MICSVNSFEYEIRNFKYVSSRLFIFSKCLGDIEIFASRKNECGKRHLCLDMFDITLF